MTTIWERVSTALAELSVPVVENVLITTTGETMPDQYVVFRMISSPTAQHADDAETLRYRNVQLSTFSRTGLASLPDVVTPMIAAGFTHGPDTELPYNPATRHYGLVQEFTYLEEE